MTNMFTKNTVDLRIGPDVRTHFCKEAPPPLSLHGVLFEGSIVAEFFYFIYFYLCRVEYAAKEADFYTALPKQKINKLITVIKDEITLRTICNNTRETKT